MKSKYFEAISFLRKDYTVRQLCKAFKVSPSGYYNYLKQPTKVASTRDLEDIEAIQKVYKASGGTFGAKKIAGTLKNNTGRIINHKRVSRLMKELNIQSKIRRKKSNKEKKIISAGYVYPNLLERNFDALLPNKKWAMDVTEFPYNGERIFLSVIMDLFDRNPIGFVVSRSPDNKMMEDTIRLAIHERNLNDLENIIIHTDQGNIYRSFRYNQLSRELKFTPSMSRKANCWDNAVIESFFSHFKTEMPHHYPFRSALQIEADIPKFMNYFKEKRTQKRLGYLSPQTFLDAHFKRAS